MLLGKGGKRESPGMNCRSTMVDSKQLHRTMLLTVYATLSHSLVFPSNLPLLLFTVRLTWFYLLLLYFTAEEARRRKVRSHCLWY